MVSPKEMVLILRSKSLRCRTGILALPDSAFGAESEIAAKLGVDMLDYRKHLLSFAPAGSQFLNLTLNRIFIDLDMIANATTGEICVLAANFDIAVAKLCTDDQRILWRTLFSDFPNKTRALILCVPSYEEACFYFRDTEIRRMWQESDRYSNWLDSQGLG